MSGDRGASGGRSAAHSEEVERQSQRRVAGRILLVEDDEDNRRVYQLILEHGGFEVLEARTGSLGLTLAMSARPDLILMDISVPEIDGWEATRILKGEATTRCIPVLILTAHAMASDRIRAEEAGCDGYLIKPVSPSRVLEEVTRRLFPLPAAAQPSDNQPCCSA